jgi:hypothetical protein
MLDLMDNRIAVELAEYHLYPFAQNIYHDIFWTFSHFPLPLKEVYPGGEGETITLVALVVSFCLKQPRNPFPELYQKALTYSRQKAQPHFPQDVTVETFLACLLFKYHPTDLHDAIVSLEAGSYFDDKQIYEFNLKKKTVLLNAV